MSHFVMMVVTEQYPTPALLSEVLQPRHEFECTGVEDEYVKEVDLTEEARCTYETDKCHGALLDPDGEPFYPYNDKGNYKDGFYQAGEYGQRVLLVPPGYTKLEEPLPAKAVQKFAEWVSGYYGTPILHKGQEPDLESEHKYGWTLVDPETKEVIQLIRRTNPDKKWDGWTIGGRYEGRLLIKGSSAKRDVARVSALDIEGMRQAKRVQRRELFNSAVERLNGNRLEKGLEPLQEDEVKQVWRFSVEGGGWASVMADREKSGFKGNAWEYIEATLPKDDPRRVCTDLGVQAALAGYFEGIGVDGHQPDIEEWIENPPALTSWGVVKDGEWHEKGAMGWFGLATDEMTEEKWAAEFDKLLTGLHPDLYIAMVDFHI